MNNSGYLTPLPHARPRIFAHRGFTLLAGTPTLDENTLEAFELALSSGADYIETDIQVTSDGVPVIFHDKNLFRLAGRKQPISKIAVSDLQKLTLPLGSKVPTLRQALERFPGAKFNLDLKTPAAIETVPKFINSLGWHGNVLLTSFSERSRLKALARVDAQTATSPGAAKVAQLYFASGNQKLFRKLSAGLHALQIPAKMYGLDFTSPKFIETVLNTDLELHYWTINDPAQMLALAQLGAHGIVTDRTDLAIKTFS